MGSIINARWSRLAGSLAIVAGLLSVGSVVLAHECTDDRPGNGQGQARGHRSEECQDTTMAPNWRDPYVPLFTLADHEDEEQRHEAQRWRDEWGCDTQHCVWVKTNSSVDGGTPTSVHAGTAADHSMFEVAHQSENHGDSESNHDAHGGAVYADVCVSSDEGTSYEGQAGACEGPEDTEVGVVLVDHNSCGTVVPYVSCTDEYHLVRPLDGDYTEQQMDNTRDAPEQIAEDPHRYLCGHGPGSDDCLVPDELAAG